TAAITAATAALRLGPRLVDRQRSAVVVLAMQSGDRRLRLLRRAHLHKGKSLRASGHPIHDELDRFDGPEGLEQLEQVAVGHGVPQVADIEFLGHPTFSSKKAQPDAAWPSANAPRWNQRGIRNVALEKILPPLRTKG